MNFKFRNDEAYRRTSFTGCFTGGENAPRCSRSFVARRLGVPCVAWCGFLPPRPIGRFFHVGYSYCGFVRGPFDGGRGRALILGQADHHLVAAIAHEGKERVVDIAAQVPHGSVA